MIKRIMVAVICIPLLAVAVYGISPDYPVILPILVAGLSMIAVHEVLWSTGFVKDLRISTLSILVAQIPAVRQLRGASNLGLFFGMMFLCVVGFSVDIQGFLGSAFAITALCFSVIAGSLILHLLITRALKIKYEYVLLGIVGAIADGTSAALVASGAKWKSLISVGLLMGIIGAVCGNYCGITIAYLVRALSGVG